MTNEKQTGPAMAGADDATADEKASGLAEQVRHDHGGEDDEAAVDDLRERAAQTDEADRS
jgi:hypothetical protein